jgi:hypothetical protein
MLGGATNYSGRSGCFREVRRCIDMRWVRCQPGWGNLDRRTARTLDNRTPSRSYGRSQVASWVCPDATEKMIWAPRAIPATRSHVCGILHKPTVTAPPTRDLVPDRPQLGVGSRNCSLPNPAS